MSCVNGERTRACSDVRGLATSQTGGRLPPVAIPEEYMLSTTIGRLRLIGLIEGVSFLLLLGVAMPLKYMMGMPKAVSVVGMAHGVLFVLYCVALWLAMEDRDWPLKKGFIFFMAAVVPFGPFLVDRRLKEEEGRSADPEEAMEEDAG